MKKRVQKHKKLISLGREKRRSTTLPIWITLLIMFLAGLVYGFMSIRCECSSKIGCAGCAYLESSIMAGIFFVLVSIIPVVIVFFIIRNRKKFR